MTFIFLHETKRHPLTLTVVSPTNDGLFPAPFILSAFKRDHLTAYLKLKNSEINGQHEFLHCLVSAFLSISVTFNADM